MKFYIKKITLWFKNGGQPRHLQFEKNKVNIITGEKSKGKSSLLSIIDYCLLSTDSRIVEEVINENTAWYGLEFSINEKDYLIIRKHPNKHIGSKEVFFSGSGEYPEIIKGNIDINKLKTIIESEFGIDETLVIPYGGKKLRMGSKISFRYFLLFNTLSEDTITSSNIFFDFDLYDRGKYSEALDRIFFLAIGVDDIRNVLLKEQLNSLENELDKIEKKKKLLGKEEMLFNDRIIKLVSKAQEFDLVERRLFTFDEALKVLTRLVNEYASPSYSNNLKQADDLNKEKRNIWKRIRGLERFNQEYDEYKKNLTIEKDSLLPVEYLKQNFSELIPTLEVKTFISSLETSLSSIKKEISDKKSISVKAKSEIIELKRQLEEIDQKLSILPTSNKEFADEIQKYIFIGELKSQLNFYKDKWNIVSELPDENELLSQINELQKKLSDTAESKKVILEFFEASIQKYYSQTHSMGVYEKYKVLFDVSKKALKLRKPDEIISRSVIGSKSNYMFLHLCLFLGMHEHFINQNVVYVPQFLLIDQPSQPYLESLSINPETGEITSDDDRNTIKDAFALINFFMKTIIEDYKEDFQIILLEHASKDHWENPHLEYFHLVDEFRKGNALIPNEAMLNKS